MPDETKNGATAVPAAASASATSTAAASDALAHQLQVLRAAYAARLPEKIARLEELLNGEIEAATEFESQSFRRPPAETALDAAHRLAHNLAGSGATYGFAQLSRAARTLEQLLKTAAARAVPPPPQEQAEIAALLAAVRAAALTPDDAPNVQSAPPNNTLTNAPPQHTAGAGHALPAPVGASPWRADDKPIFCVAAEPRLAADLARQIAYFGYTAQAFSSQPEGGIEAMKAAIEREPPAALVVDAALCADVSSANADADADAGLDFCAGGSDDAGRIAISEIQTARKAVGVPPLPVLFIAERGDMMARLRAVRAGGAAYFTKPIDVAEVIDALDVLTAQEAPEPYRVLIVDDDPELAAFHAGVLQRAGMKIHVVNDPLQVMQPLTDFRPDLILMDVYMPACSGLELATVIRQQHDYVGTPIVFLSGETDVDKQMAAMRLGGDDFLTKPIQPEHLVAAVMARAQRSRSMRSFMVRDSLTGLLNHTAIKEQLDIEVTRARRRNAPLAFAMLDIDRFKSINDSYGHLTGDRVIKNIARLLTQRLRKTDIIGRYGGEEFAVILSDTDGPTARRVLDEIRASFAQLKQQSGGTEFSVTFSGGIATFPAHDNAARLNDAADKALYEAKRAGRNRVLLTER